MKRTLITIAVAAIFMGCWSATAPIGKPELKCNDDCKSLASKQCDDVSCARGCRFILDRLVEHEGHHVVECVAKASACDDPVWADCAAKIGPHADGGPPAPPPPKDSDFDDGT
jgi:hypothetical protein